MKKYRMLNEAKTKAKKQLGIQQEKRDGCI